MRTKNYYKILEVPEKATTQDIKKAYRRLAMKFHPDRNADDKFAEAHFKEIQEAYYVLSDSRRRSGYNQQRWYRYSSHSRSTAPITPAEVLEKCRELCSYLSSIDAAYINQQPLYQYINQLLSPATMQLLHESNDLRVNEQVIHQLLKAGKTLPSDLFNKISRHLLELAAEDEDLVNLIATQVQKRRLETFWHRYQPLLVLAFTILLCGLIYLVCR